MDLGLRLVRQAGWNQIEADWRRIVDLQPADGLVAEVESEPIATLSCACYGPVAWIAMMLVDQGWRGRGIGRALMTHALEALDGRGLHAVRLDATPLGQPLYESMGFVPEYAILRLGGRPSSDKRAADARLLDPARMADLRGLDRAITGIDRARLIDRLVAENPGTVRVAGPGGETAGYGMTRPGFQATQIGPCLGTPEAGLALLGDALSRHAGSPVIVDIPAEQGEAIASARSRGLTVRREFLRMRRGAPVAERTPAIWAGAGPDLG